MGEARGVTFLKDIIEVAIDIELVVADLYDTFASNFSDDEELSLFWRLYAEAERYHAATIRVHQAAFAQGDVVDGDAFPTEMSESLAFVDKVKQWIADYQATPPTVEQAFEVARTIENSAAEIHGRTQFFRLYPQFRELFVSMVEEDLGHRHMLEEAAQRFTTA